MDQLKWATICHPDFPNTILTVEECRRIVVSLNTLDTKHRIQSTTIKIGWVLVSYTQSNTLTFLRNSIPSRPTVLPAEPPDFFAIFLDIPSSIAETKEETLRIIRDGGPNRELWKIVSVSERDGFHKVVLSVPEQSVADLQNTNCIIKFKGQPFNARLEVYKRKANDISSPGSSVFHKSPQLLGSVSCSPGFEKPTTSQETPEDILARRLYNYLRKLNIASIEANERTRNALIRYKKFKLDTKVNCSLGKHGFDFFNVEVLFNRLECLQLIDEIAQPTDYSTNNFFILCHKEFPKVFIDTPTLISIKEKLTDFLRTIPVKLAVKVESILIVEGCIKVYHGNDGTLKWMKRIVECQQSWTVLNCADIPKFRCVALALPCSKVRDQSNDEILADLKRENISLNFSSWFIASRSPDTGILKSVMDIPSYGILEKAAHHINFLGVPYTAQPLPDLVKNSLVTQQTKTKPENKQNVENWKDIFNSMNQEGENLNTSNEALTQRLRDEAGTLEEALTKYKQFKLLVKRSNSEKEFSFFNPEILEDNFINILLFNDMLTQPNLTNASNFILCHKLFPERFFNLNDLVQIEENLREFVSKSPVKLSIGKIWREEGWFRVDDVSEETFKWLKRVAYFTKGSLYPLKLLPKDHIASFFFITVRIPHVHQGDKAALKILKKYNSNFSTIKITRRVPMDAFNEIITILLDLPAFEALKMNSFCVRFSNDLLKIRSYRQFTSENGIIRFDVPEAKKLQTEKNMFCRYLINSGMGSDVAEKETEMLIGKYSEFKLLIEKHSSTGGFTFFHKDILRNNFENLIIFNDILKNPFPIFQDDNYFILCHVDFPKVFLSKSDLIKIRNRLNEFLNKSPVRVAIGDVIVDEGWLIVRYGNEAALRWLKSVVKCTQTTPIPLNLFTQNETPCCGFFHLKLPLGTLERFGKDEVLRCLIKENNELKCESWQIARYATEDEQDDVTIVMNIKDFKNLNNNLFHLKFLGNPYTCEPCEFSRKIITNFLNSKATESMYNTTEAANLESELEKYIFREMENDICPATVTMENKDSACTRKGIELNEARRKSVQEVEPERPLKSQKQEHLQLQKVEKEFSEALKEKEILNRQKDKSLEKSVEKNANFKIDVNHINKEKKRRTSSSSSSSSISIPSYRTSRSRRRDRKYSKHSRDHNRSRSQSNDQSIGYSPALVNPPNQITTYSMDSSNIPSQALVLPVPAGHVRPPSTTFPGLSNTLPYNLNTAPINASTAPGLKSPAMLPKLGAPIHMPHVPDTAFFQNPNIPPYFGNDTHRNIYSHVTENEVSQQDGIPMHTPLIEQPKDVYDLALQHFYQRLQTKEAPMNKGSGKDREKSRSRSRSKSRERLWTRRSRSSSRPTSTSYGSSRSCDRRHYDSDRYRSRYSPSRSRQSKDVYKSRRGDRAPSVSRSRSRSHRISRSRSRSHRISRSRSRSHRISRSRSRSHRISRSRSRSHRILRSRSRSSAKDKSNRGESLDGDSATEKAVSRECKADMEESILECESEVEDLIEGPAVASFGGSSKMSEEVTWLKDLQEGHVVSTSEDSSKKAEEVTWLEDVQGELVVTSSRDSSKMSEEVTWLKEVPGGHIVTSSGGSSKMAEEVTCLKELQGGSSGVVREAEVGIFSNPPNPMETAEEKLMAKFNDFVDELKDLYNYFKNSSAVQS